MRDRHDFMWQSVEILNDFIIFRLKQIFWKTITYFQPIFRFLVGGSKTGNASNKNLPYQKSMLRKIKWWVKNGPITKNGVLPLPTSFFWKSCFSLRTSYKELIWCTSYPDVYIRTFCERWSFLWRWFFLVSILSELINFCFLLNDQKTLGLLVISGGIEVYLIRSIKV